jgi:hypothetical protein
MISNLNTQITCLTRNRVLRNYIGSMSYRIFFPLGRAGGVDLTRIKRGHEK